MKRPVLALAAVLAVAAAPCPAAARDSLGIWNDWGAFRDPGVPRCYAIAMARPAPGRPREFQPYLTIGTWPTRDVRGQVHVRLARRVAPGARVTLSLGGQSFDLVAGGASAWAADRRADAAIVALVRSAGDLTVAARGTDGRTFRDSWRLAGIASALDAAALGCAGR
ncbi:hypothetical protein OLX02_08730 [Novosphingobium sp. KCTC 2891]|uniref:hypothetical protein n=1 Tax=Novosphingobium sp. KCTC 2891 TaxID=2989730 RepID=UPI002222FADF|nr:hypothetical protein [Novosphingobium sp. KCTC 2891]MCW1382907.1 hypothetical protein [Novosphingobium sp. KCTC 2891]